MKQSDARLWPDVFIGGEPLWHQNPAHPKRPDGTPMRFLGQLRTGRLTESLADAHIYLLRDPKARRIVQITQF